MIATVCNDSKVWIHNQDNLNPRTWLPCRTISFAAKSLTLINGPSEASRSHRQIFSIPSCGSYKRQLQMEVTNDTAHLDVKRGGHTRRAGYFMSRRRNGKHPPLTGIHLHPPPRACRCPACCSIGRRWRRTGRPPGGRPAPSRSSPLPCRREKDVGEGQDVLPWSENDQHGQPKTSLLQGQPVALCPRPP